MMRAAVSRKTIEERRFERPDAESRRRCARRGGAYPFNEVIEMSVRLVVANPGNPRPHGLGPWWIDELDEPAGAAAGDREVFRRLSRGGRGKAIAGRKIAEVELLAAKRRSA